MISLIVCTKNKELLTELAQNIADTIGLVYELIIIKMQMAVLVYVRGIIRVPLRRNMNFSVLCTMISHTRL